MRSYWGATSQAAYSFFFSLPLLAGYEGLLWLVGPETSSNRNLVQVWLERLIGWAMPYSWVLSIGVMLLGLAYVYGLKRSQERLRGWVFGLMLAESVMWAVLIWRFLPQFFQYLAAPAQLGVVKETLQSLALCLGAGFYEELFFRVLLVELLVWLLVGLRAQRAGVMHFIGAWFLSAVLFSAAHFLYEPFSWYAFWYRGAFGLVMSGLYIIRGFGIAAWTHALYDILVLFR